MSASCEDHLEQIEILEDPAYTDTVRSVDSTASFLRRTLSLPLDYQYSKRDAKHVKDLFEEPAADKNKDEHNFRQTMEDLLEKPEYVDSLESNCSKKELLAKAGRDYANKKSSKHKSASSDQEAAKNAYKKNLLILSVSYMLLFIAVLSIRNLQSSLNDDVGLTSLGALYASQFLTSIFSTSIVQRVRPRNTMAIAFFLYIVYVGANFYPVYYILLPAAAICGFAMAISFTAQATYLTNIALGYSSVSGTDVRLVLTRFNSVFYVFFQLAQISGGVLSSLVLKRSPTSQTLSLVRPLLHLNLSEHSLNLTSRSVLTAVFNYNSSHLVTMPNSIVSSQCGADYCPDNGLSAAGSSTVDQTRVFILVGIFSASAIIALVLLLTCLDPLEGEMKTAHASLKQQLAACFRFFVDWRAVCLLPLMFYSLLQISFMFGEFSKVCIV